MILTVCISLAAALGSLFVAWYVDDRVTRSRSPVTGILAAMLLGFAVWIWSAIHVSFWMEVPGAYGSAQYWGDSDIEDMVSVRYTTLITVIVGMGFGLLTIILTIARRRSWRGLTMPIVSLAAFAIAYGEFVVHRFYPSA